jgi:hypothetical protein
MIVYINSASFSNATSVFLDELLTDIAPDGFYSYDSYYRQQINGMLIDLLPCPNVDTVSITAVGETTATFNGNLIGNGGDVNAIRGFVYGTSPNPTTANSVITDTVRGQGAYSLNVTGLASVVQYYVRAYSIVFGETIYGDQLNFTTIVIVPCDGTGDAGGLELSDQYVNLNSIGGVIVFLFDPIGQVDKLEIYHGLPQNGGVNKKATTSQSATGTYGGNYGPFDNVWGTLPSNSLPNDPDLPVDQFIGKNKGTVPTRQSQYTSDTGYVVPSMTVGGRAYDQVVWWKYTAADYLISNVATIRATGGSTGTAWYSVRLCP